MEAAPAAKLSFGRVFSDTFGVVKRRWAPLLILTLAATLPGFLVLFLVTGGVDARAAVESDGFQAGVVVAVLVFYALTLFLYGAQLAIAIRDLQGAQVSIGDAAREGLRRMLPILGLIILLGLGVGLGMPLLVIPGLILAIMWSVALPALVGEGLGPIKALGRSRTLTRGNRWRIFGIYVVVLLVLFVSQFIVALLTGGFANPEEPTVVAAVTGIVLSAAYNILTMAFTAALYTQLRGIKEGTGGETMAQVFD